MSRIILIVAFLWLWPGMAAARTARLVKEGIKLLNNARYALAIGKFKEAYADDNTLTRALLLSGVCHLNLDQIEDAITAYERFEREERPLDPDDQARLLTYYEEAERRLTRLLPIFNGAVLAVVLRTPLQGGGFK